MIDHPAPAVLLRLTRVTRSFGETPALIDVSVDLPAGRIVGLVGRNGAGKTTLIRCVAGLLAPSSGQAEIGPWNIGAEPGRALGAVGYLGSSDRSFPPRLTARESLGLYGVLQGLTRRDALSRAEQLARRLRAEALLDRTYQRLSSGERQRIGVIRALMHDPAVVLLDEPTYALDRAGAKEVFALLRECAERGMLVIISSHDLESVEAGCDDLLILQRGRLVASGPSAAVLPRLDRPMWRITFDDAPSREQALRASAPELRAGRDPRVALLRDGGQLAESGVDRWPGVRLIERREHASLSELLESYTGEERQGAAEMATEVAPMLAVEGPATSPARRALAAIVRRDMLTEFSYRFKIVVQFGVLLLWAVMMHFMAQVYRQDEGLGAALFHNPMGFLLIGLAALEVSNVCIARMGRAIREDQLMGTLEPLLATGRRPLLWVTGSLLWPLWTALALAAGLFAAVHAAMGWSVDPSWTAAGAAAALGCVALAALGLISAAFVHRFKRGDPVALVVNMLGLLAAGAYFPREVLPDWIQSATSWVPYTSAINAVRSALLAGESLGSEVIQEELIKLAAFDAAAVPIAVLIWTWAHRRARRLGLLTNA